jgi:hypothetical protein
MKTEKSESARMDATLIEKVRTACRAVAERATRVHISYDSIPAYAAFLAQEPFMRPLPDPNSHHIGDPHDMVAFFLTLGTINFGSGYFPHLRKRTGMSGYFTVAGALKDYYRDHGAFSAQTLSQLTPDQCAKIFGQDLRKTAIRDLMRLFSTALNDLGRYLLDHFDGSFVGLVETAGSSAEKLVQILVGMPYFNDVGSYGGLQVPLYKRAQLTAADLYLSFHGKGLGRFDDMDRLTIFADNLVPHVLRIDEILDYQEDLADHIDRGEP